MEHIQKTIFDFDFNQSFGSPNGDGTVTYHLCNTAICTQCAHISNRNSPITITEQINHESGDEAAVYFRKVINTGRIYSSSRNGKLRCPGCGGCDVVLVDDLMAEVIKGFIKKGWKTRECCSGHPYVDDGKIYCSPTFITFDMEVPPKNLKYEVQELMAANEKIGIEGFHIFLIAETCPCEIMPAAYTLCIYINDRLPKTSVSMDYPCPLCDRIQFNNHMYSYLNVSRKWDKKSSYQKAVDTIEKRNNGLLGITAYISDRTHK